MKCGARHDVGGLGDRFCAGGFGDGRASRKDFSAPSARWAACSGLVLAAWNYGRARPILQPLVHIEAVADASGFC